MIVMTCRVLVRVTGDEPQGRSKVVNASLYGSRLPRVRGVFDARSNFGERIT